ncbi:MAG: FAD-dependent oxidoreductase [Gemmataceae bacterium]|nr:FAD-dependent oxidoreductase [Gemmataceae bacterium]
MTRPRLLVLGSGFAAYRLARDASPALFDVAVVSRRNHFVYTPLLPSTAVGTIEFRTIVEPVRRGRPNLRFLLASAVSVDLTARTVRCRNDEAGLEWDEPFDHLAIGVGAENATYGIPGVREHCLFLKELDDARRLRQGVLTNLERASLPGLPTEERRRLLHFVAVGAGPTGVRFAAELHDLLRGDLRRHYPALAREIRLTLLEAGKSILGAFEADLRDYTLKAFARRGIEVRTDTAVAEAGPGWLRLKSGEILPTGLVLWATGFAPSDFVKALPLEKDRAGRIVTDEYLQVAGQPRLYALGDCACPRGQNLPQLAQVAEQQGKYLADALARRAQGKAVHPFRWRNLGFNSYIGDSEAVVQSGGGKRRWAGWWAYQLWRSAIFTDLVSLKNKVLVPLSRLMAAIFGRDLSRF